MWISIKITGIIQIPTNHYSSGINMGFSFDYKKKSYISTKINTLITTKRAKYTVFFFTFFFFKALRSQPIKFKSLVSAWTSFVNTFFYFLFSLYSTIFNQYVGIFSPTNSILISFMLSATMISRPEILRWARDFFFRNKVFF